MAGELKRSIVFDLFARSEQFERAMGTAASRLDTVSSKMRMLGDNMATFGARYTRSVSVPIVAAGGLMIKAASDQAEAYDKARVIFDDFADTVIAWSEDAPEAMGLTSAAAIDAAANFSNMFQAQGLAGDQATDMSTNLVQLAADMGSLNNVDPTDMLVKLQAAIAGEVEPLRRFGVNVSAAAVKQKAFEEGIAETGRELTEQEKILARYLIIQDQTVTAQGNYAATAEGAANATRTLKASLGDLLADFGELLLPYFQRAVAWGQDLLQRFRDLDPAAKELAVKIAAIAAAAFPLLYVGGKLVTLFGVIAKHPIIAAVVALGGAFVWAYHNSEEFRRVVDGVVDWLEGTAWPVIRDVAAAIGDAFAGAADWIGRNWQNVYNVVKEIINLWLRSLQNLRNQFQWMRNAANLLPGVDLGDLPNFSPLPDANAAFPNGLDFRTRNPVSGGGIRGGGDTYNFNIEGSVTSEQDLADFVVRTVVDAGTTGRVGGL